MAEKLCTLRDLGSDLRYSTFKTSLALRLWHLQCITKISPVQGVPYFLESVVIYAHDISHCLVGKGSQGIQVHGEYWESLFSPSWRILLDKYWLQLRVISYILQSSVYGGNNRLANPRCLAFLDDNIQTLFDRSFSSHQINSEPSGVWSIDK